jgi:hypothetical protein
MVNVLFVVKASIITYVEGNFHGKFGVIFQYSPRGTEEYHKRT